MNDDKAQDAFVQCAHCGSTVCYAQQVGEIETLTCMSCGFSTNSQMQEDSEMEKAIREKYPVLYRELRFKDRFGYIWYPSVVTIPDRGIVYVDESGDSWEWVSVPMRKITKKERRTGKYLPEQEYVTVMSERKAFGKDGFIHALSSIKAFE